MWESTQCHGMRQCQWEYWPQKVIFDDKNLRSKHVFTLFPSSTMKLPFWGFGACPDCSSLDRLDYGLEQTKTLGDWWDHRCLSLSISSDVCPSLTHAHVDLGGGSTGCVDQQRMGPGSGQNSDASSQFMLGGWEVENGIPPRNCDHPRIPRNTIGDHDQVAGSEQLRHTVWKWATPGTPNLILNRYLDSMKMIFLKGSHQDFFNSGPILSTWCFPWVSWNSFCRKHLGKKTCLAG